MNTEINKLIGALMMSATAVSCGGNADRLEGIFSDSPVAGVNFETETTSGVTNADGTFIYREGESVVFSIGNMALPVVLASEIVTPLDMGTEPDINDQSVVNIARLLQSLDDDGDPENGILISDETASTFTDSVVFDTTDNSAVADLVYEVYGVDRQAVTAEQAISHFVDTLSANTGSNGTLDQLTYLVGAGQTFEGESLYVDPTEFSLAIEGEVHTGASSVNQGVYQLSGMSGTWFVSVEDTTEAKLACIEKAPISIANCEDGLYHLFEEEEQAMAFGIAENQTRAESEDTNANNESTDLTSEPESGAATDTSEDTSTSVDLVIDELSSEEPFPECDSGTTDSDGDGYGWQDSKTCLIVVASEVENSSDNVAEPIPATETPEVVVEPVVDKPTENAASSESEAPAEPEAPSEPEVPSAPEVPSESEVLVESELPSRPEVTVEPEALSKSVVPTEPKVPSERETPTEPEILTEPEELSESEVPTEPEAGVQPSDITDIIVLTGQANAAGVGTSYDAALDEGDENLFAYNEDGEWQPANLDQYWDANLPSNYASVEDGREPYNNLVFQTGKVLTSQTDRVVGIILVAAPGEGIRNWDYNSAFYKKIRNKVAQALDALPQKDTIDTMIWMQGETDWLAEGTADPDATGFASKDSDFYRNYYPTKLNYLIANLRSEWWYGREAQFICSETKKTDLNHHLMALNDDGDDRTSCAQASDLPTRESDPYNNHFSATALRELGRRIAELYLSGTN